MSELLFLSLSNQHFGPQPLLNSAAMSVSRVSFIRALYDLFYISLVRFQPKAHVFTWNLVAANTAG